MRVGVPKEIKVLENRVGLTPGSVREAVHSGNEVIVEHNAGQGIGMDDEAYRRAGGRVVDTAAEVFAAADMIVKVKEPQANERKMLRHGQVLFTYLHLAPDPEQAQDLIASGAVCIAYETVTSPSGGLPLLAPMSEVAGRMAVQAGAYYLEKPHGGIGILLGGVPGVDPAKVVILGGGVVGSHACHIALGMGADVWVLDRSVDVLRALWRQFGRPLNTVYSTRDAVEQHVTSADHVIGGVLITGASAPKLVSRELIARMKPGAVVVDVALDTGGCFVRSRPTTHPESVYVAAGATAALAPTPRVRWHHPEPRRAATISCNGSFRGVAMNTMTETRNLAVTGKQKMTPSEAFVETLVAQSVKDVFGIVGSAYMDALDLFPLAGIRFISVAHEQGGGHMADGYARVSGKHGVCIAQNGPGITNFVTATAAAFWAHSPVVVVTPETGSMTLGLGGFQETEQLPIFSKITKYQAHVNNRARMAELTARAFDRALLELGPAQLNIPRDFFYGDIECEIPRPVAIERGAGGEQASNAAAELLASAQFPVILCGGGVIMADALAEAIRLAELGRAHV